MLNRAGRITVRRVTAVAGLALVAALLTVSTPSSADPNQTIAQVKAKIDRLNHEAEIATEEFNHLRDQITRTRAVLAPLRKDVSAQAAKVDRLRRAVISSAVNDYTNSAGLTSTTSVFTSSNPHDLIEQISNRQVAQQQSADLLRTMTLQSQRLHVKRAQLNDQLRTIRSDQRTLDQRRREIERKLAEAQHVLDGLQAQQRQRLLALQNKNVVTTTPTTRTTPTTTTRSTPRINNASASARAQIAIAFAMAQLGKPYQYGAAGPNSYDCSGLTMASWAQAGVNLSHYAPDQQYAGTQVSISQLVPGDLVFYYSLPSHVAMYIGHGLVIHAPHTGSVVQIVPLLSMPVHSATHIG